MTDKPCEPKSDLAKLLLVLTQEIAAGLSARAFENIHLENALKQADRIAAEDLQPLEGSGHGRKRV